MKEAYDAFSLLDLMVQGAFCARDGVIVQVNSAARQRLIREGDRVEPLLATGAEEYGCYTGGQLFLIVKIGDQVIPTVVDRIGDTDIFRLEPDEDQAVLQSMALVARELRDPLSSLMIVTDRMFPGLPCEEGETAQQMGQINHRLYQILRIVSNLSDATRYTGQPQAPTQVRELTSLIREQLEKARALSAESGIRLDYDIPDEQVYCPVNTELLERAVYNLLSNALKFTPADGIVHCRLICRGTKAYLTVTDTGSGIPKELRGTVYSRYLRQPAIEDGRHGIGLGLLMVKAAAAAHGGTVLMEHPAEGGLKVTLSLSTKAPENTTLRSPAFTVDYAGERSHALIELADALPADLYKRENIN